MKADKELMVYPLEIKRVQEDGSFEGYASLFGREDLGRDVVVRGAFKTSLQKRGVAGIKMLFQHDPSQVIGVWEEIKEDAKGLYVRGRLLTKVAKAREVLALMREGALDGLSIGFRTVKGKREKRTGVRRLQQIDLWEISIVTFPMLPDARVLRVKERRPFAAKGPTRRELERWLTQDARLTRSEARALMRIGFKGLVARRDAAMRRDAGGEMLVGQLRNAASILRGC